jgi:hypothetical protein
MEHTTPTPPQRNSGSTVAEPSTLSLVSKHKSTAVTTVMIIKNIVKILYHVSWIQGITVE